MENSQLDDPDTTNYARLSTFTFEHDLDLQLSPSGSAILSTVNNGCSLQSTNSMRISNAPHSTQDHGDYDRLANHDRPPIHRNRASDEKLNASNAGILPSSTQPAANEVSWLIDWQQPIFMLSMLFSGIILSAGHHIYYRSLHGTVAGDSARQAWSLQFGSAFAFLIVICFRAVTVAALGQIIWTIVTRKALTIGSLDKLYALTTNPFSILSISMFKNARLALCVGAMFWCMDFIGFAPTATLSVVAKNVSVEVAIPVLDSSKDPWKWVGLEEFYGAEPGRLPNRIASQAAYMSDVVPLSRPVSSHDWSYDMTFFGPSVRCRLATSIEQTDFDRLTVEMEVQEDRFTALMIGDQYWNCSTKYCGKRFLFYFAWARFNGNFTSESGFGGPETKEPPDTGYFWDLDSTAEQPHILLQTSTSSIVCLSINSSFDITIASVNGQQQITQRDIHQVNDLSDASRLDPSIKKLRYDMAMYLSHHMALASTIVGNVSLSVQNDGVSQEGEWRTVEESNICGIVALGILACQEIQDSPFMQIVSSENGTHGPLALYEVCPTQPWQCRNQSIMQAIEDLSNNITISYLSSPDLTNSNSTFRNITTSDTINVYVYRPLFLLISYGLGSLFATIAACIGLYSIHLNGVSYSITFSTILTTTRNPDLDALTKGSSLGAEPLVKNIKETKLKFGPLIWNQGKGKEKSDHVPHIAFGLEGTVGDLKKGGKYI